MFSYFPDIPFASNPRGYVKGIEIQYNQLVIPLWNPPFIEFAALPNYFWRIAIADWFYEPSSKSIRLDQLFDPDNSLFTIGGVPDVAGCLTRFGYRTDGDEWVGICQLTLSVTHTYYLPLPAMPSDYWINDPDGDPIN